MTLVLLAILSTLAAQATAPDYDDFPPSGATRISASVPAAWDWRDVDGVDYLSPARSVASCGSSYIFAPMAMVEARFQIETVRGGGALPDVDYSEQHVMSCGSGYFGDFDCNGGYCMDILTHIRDNGVATEACYAYVSVDQSCPTDCPDSLDDLILYWPVEDAGEMYPYPSEADLMQEIYDNGPVAVTMDVYEDFISYAGGVYEYTSGANAGGHAVMLVGWGEDGGTPYWICRNVWGEGWGDSGDFLIARNAQHAGCDFGEWVWTCTINTNSVSNTPLTWGQVKARFR